jgi:hypothetical protein
MFSKEPCLALSRNQPVSCLFAELTHARNISPALTNEEALSKDDTSSEVDIPGDDSAIPLDVVEDTVHGLLPIDDGEQEYIIGQHGIVSAAEAEETLVESVNGVILDTTSTTNQALGRGQRKKTRNINCTQLSHPSLLCHRPLHPLARK